MLKPQDYLLNTDYEMDKIVLVKTGDFTGSVSIPHNLGYEPLAFGVWSTSEDFSTSNSLGLALSSSEVGYTPPLGVNCRAFSDRIELTATGQNHANTKIYYRLYAFEPSDSRNQAPHTSTLANKFILNTDYNYRKLKKAGEFTQSGDIYEHNLGYLPQVMAWVKWKPGSGGGIMPLLSASNETNFRIETTAKQIELVYMPSVFIEKVIWRLYYDEA